MKRNEALGTGLFAAGYLTGLAGFAALVGIVVITGCGAGDQGETTPDVAARLETQAREAAQQAKEAMEKAAQEGSDAASELAEAADGAAATALGALGDVAAGPGDAAGELAEDAETTLNDAVPGAGPAGAEDCLGLLDQGAYAEAVAACTEALGRDPENQAVKDALEKARSEAAAAQAEGAAAALPGMR